MKRIIYCLVILGIVLTGCNPVEDIYKEVDKVDRPIVGEATYTLTSDNYTDDIEDGGLGLSFPNFGSEDDAKAALPAFLDGLYPTWGEGSAVLVGYDLYIGNAFSIRDYNLDQDDYTFSGSDALGFQSDANPGDYLADILADNVSNPDEGDYRRAKYFQFTGAFGIVTPTVSLDENFDYGGAAGDLTAVSGGEWEAHSGVGFGPIGYDTANLSMTDYPSTEIGGSLTVDGGGSEDVTNWFSEISSGNVYASTLVNLSAVSTGTYTFHLRDSDFAVGYVARVGAKDDGSGKILFGIGASSSSLTYGTTPFDLDTTYLLVSSYNIDTGVANLYVLSTAEATEPTTPEATNTGTSGAIITGISIRQGGGGPTATFDGIRVANTWSSIMSNDVLDDEVVGDKVAGEMYYVYTDEAWGPATDRFYGITDEDFASMNIESFGSSIQPDDYLPTFLGIKYPYAQEGDNMDIGYTYDSSSSGLGTRGNLYTVIDGIWVGYESTISTSLQFGHDGDSWVPDNTIRYTFDGADVSFISSAFETIYPGPADNVGFFGSFDRRSGSSNFWSDDMLLEAFNALLESGGFVTDEGQKYVLTYVIYNGSTTDETKNVIKTGGVWVYQE